MEIELNQYIKTHIITPLSKYFDPKDKLTFLIASAALLAFASILIYFTYSCVQYFRNRKITQEPTDPGLDDQIAELRDIRLGKVKNYKQNLEKEVKYVQNAIKELQINDESLRNDIYRLIDNIQSNANKIFEMRKGDLVDKEAFNSAFEELNKVRNTYTEIFEQKKGAVEVFRLLEWQFKAKDLIRECQEHCYPKHIKQFEELIKGKSLNQMASQIMDGTLLHFLAKMGNPIEFIKILASNGINFNQKDKWGNTALMWAIASSQYRMALEILDWGKTNEINLNIQGMNLNTALHILVGKGNEKVGDISQEFLIEKMIQEGADPNLINIDVLTPVHFAFLRRDLKVIDFFLKNGGSLEMSDLLGRTPEDLLELSYQEVQEILSKKIDNLKLDEAEFKKSLPLIRERLLNQN